MKLFLICCLLFGIGNGANWYVQEGASAGTGTVGSPFATMNAAHTAATSGTDTIILIPRADGNPYTLCMEFNYISKSLTFQSQTGTTVVLDCGTYFSFYMSTVGLKVTINNLRFEFNSQPGYNAILSDYTTVVVNNCQFIKSSVAVSSSGAVFNATNCVFDGTGLGSTASLDLSSSSVTHYFSNNIFRRHPSTSISLSSGAAVFSNNFFIDNNVHFGGSGSLTRANFTSNSFSKSVSAGTSPAFSCSTGTYSYSGNSFCGYNIAPISSCSLSIGASNLVPRDACGICNGNNQNKDCNGTCFGSAIAPNCRVPVSVNVSDYTSLVAAINSAGYNDTIILAEGTYTIPAGVSLNLQGKAITIRSRYNEPERTIIACTSGSNAPALNLTNGESYDTKFRALTFTNCYSRSVFMDFDIGASFTDCIFSNSSVNVVFSGGAVSVSNSWPTFTGCAFVNIFGATRGSGINVRSDANKYASATITGCRFQGNFVYDTGGAVSGTNIVTITKSLFINNYADVLTGNAVYTQTGSLSISQSNFTSINATEVNCQTNLAGSSGSGNVFCGGGVIGCSNIAVTTSTTIDSCGVCNGINNRDCNGTCFGRQVSDGSGGCCSYWQKDCLGRCKGNATFDNFGVCCQPQLIDCFGHCNGTGAYDRSGFCCARSLIDCNNTCNGTAKYDCAGICNGHTTYDCAGLCNGTTKYDCAGLCNGTTQYDCAGTCNGTVRFDCSGQCGGSRVYDCAGLCNGTTKYDCSGTCNGTALYDCAGTCSGILVRDCNGTCGGTATNDTVGDMCCQPNQVDCRGVCYGTYTNSTGTCCAYQCQNNGTCKTDRSGCDCAPGWGGNDCTTNLCPPPLYDCGNGGNCIGNHICNCNGTGYTGARCLAVDCGSLICDNGGNCTINETCSCGGGYSGPTCNDFNCTTPCSTHGTCAAPDFCDCGSSGYTGTTCEIPPPTPAPTPQPTSGASVAQTSSSSGASNLPLILGIIIGLTVLIIIIVIIIAVVVHRRRNRVPDYLDKAPATELQATAH